MFSECRVRGWHAFILFSLAAAQIGCGIYASIASSDTNRDIFFAHQIATGAYFPLTGPGINFMLHLGPVWYYILAIPLLLIPNAAAVTGLMTAISALQFPVAYQLGRRFGTAREGLLFALTLALPGWMNVSLASMTHTTVAATALLLGVVAAVRYRERPQATNAALVGLACVFMLTAHPTLVMLAALLVLWCATRAPAGGRWLGHACIVIGLLAVSVAPMLYTQWHDGFADVTATAKYTHAEWSIPSLFKAARLLYAVLYFGPKYVAYFFLELPSKPAHLLLLIYELVVVAAGIGIVMRLRTQKEKRGLIAALLGLLVAQSMFVCAIRVAMPPWMIYGQWPLVAALVALGLEWFCARGWIARIMVAAGLLITTLWTFEVYAHLASGPLEYADIEPSPGKRGFMDVRDYEKTKYHYRLARIPFRQLFAIGDPLCEPVALYGHYAYLVDSTYAVSAWAKCGNADNVQFGGVPEHGRRAIFGLHQSVWHQIGMRPERWIGVLGIGEPAAIWHSPVPLEPVAPELTTWPRQLKIDPRRTSISGDAPWDQAVLVSQRAHRYGPFEVVRGRIDGKVIQPVYVDSTAVVFRSPPEYSGKETVHWDIDIQATPDYVDVLTFASH